MTLYTRLAEAIEHGAAELITGWAQGVLDDVAAGRNSINAVSHPLGFVCLPVHRLGDEGVCIHVWGSRWHRAFSCHANAPRSSSRRPRTWPASATGIP